MVRLPQTNTIRALSLTSGIALVLGTNATALSAGINAGLGTSLSSLSGVKASVAASIGSTGVSANLGTSVGGVTASAAASTGSTGISAGLGTSLGSSIGMKAGAAAASIGSPGASASLGTSVSSASAVGGPGNLAMANSNPGASETGAPGLSNPRGVASTSPASPGVPASKIDGSFLTGLDNTNQINTMSQLQSQIINCPPQSCKLYIRLLGALQDAGLVGSRRLSVVSLKKSCGSIIATPNEFDGTLVRLCRAASRL